MSWDAVGAIAELVAAAGVIVSLVYLARQIGQNTRSIRVSSYQSWFGSYDSLSNLLLSDAELGALIRDGVGDPDSLSEEDLRRLQGTLRRMCRQFENLYYQQSQQMIEPSLYEGWERFFLQAVETPGFRSFWEQDRALFSEAFRAMIDEKIAAFYEGD